MEGANAETQIASTFLRLGTWDDEPADPRVDRYDQLDDVLGTTAAAFLGVTLRCARCHDHKFEPFSQADYYRMLAVFEPLRRPQKDRAALVAGPLADPARQPAGRARPGDPPLAAPFRPGAGRHPQRLRRRGRPAEPSRAARLAGVRVGGPRLAVETAAPADGPVQHLP